MHIPYGPTAWTWIASWPPSSSRRASSSFARRLLVSQFNAQRNGPGAAFFWFLIPLREILLRDFVQARLATLTGFPVALVIVSLVFGFDHALAGFRLPFMLWATLGGFPFGAVAHHFSSIVPASLMHCAADSGFSSSDPGSRRGVHARAQRKRLRGDRIE